MPDTTREHMKARCPCDLALEEYLLDRMSVPCALHVETCAVCRRRIGLMEEDTRHFREQIFPSTVSRIQDAARVSKRRKPA